MEGEHTQLKECVLMPDDFSVTARMGHPTDTPQRPPVSSTVTGLSSNQELGAALAQTFR